ncbi:Potassium channel domain-containing protein [Caenorhabditis elegans]|uniref:Potassium channel domain-containing protein n=1 Tax=Caenorhabditis elegans TaxID=6239 RepID=Q9XTV6_CAEEL|nr:Potassium channel domain-containing protein [Caenorhabditis elegans]CAB07854.2 Potassium channel domain-containing protein [Caenorhabditis elegans]|eukprot:NP_507485.2 TWiK family of potassium channels [Caenorhabditis elegans]
MTVTSEKDGLKSILSQKYTVERKDTVQHVLEGPGLSRNQSNASVLTLPGSRNTSSNHLPAQRSTSVDEVARHRVTYEMDAGKSEKSENQNPISQYYQKNHYTVTGNQETYQKLPRNISANRFQVDKASISQKSAPRASEPMEMPMLPQERQFDKSFYWFAMHRKKFGLRYIALLVLALIYTLLGATVFYLIEGSNEKSRLHVREQNLDKLLDELATVLSEAVNDPEQSSEHQRMKEFIKESYISLQKHEEQYKWSTYYRLEHPDNLKWTFSSAFFFSMNVYTTTGYGSISAQTFSGQLFTMIYAFCFVPVTLVILRDLGQMFLVNFTKLYAHGLTAVRRIRGKREVDEDEIIQLPIKFCMTILIAYLLLCTTFVYLYDAVMGPEWDDGLPYFTAFYFSFISLTTIGLGDVMPNNVPYAPPVSMIFFIGMAVTKVVNRATFIAVENGVFGLMTLAETKISMLLTERKPGVKTVRSTSSGSSAESVDSKEPRGFDGDSDSGSDDGVINRRRNEMMNTFTVRSIATFMRSNHDVYGGGFGRVQLRRGDLMSSNALHTVPWVRPLP